MILMKIKTDTRGFNPVKYSFPKKPVYYFHADEDFREDREWGKNKHTGLSKEKNSTGRAANSAAR